MKCCFLCRVVVNLLVLFTSMIVYGTVAFYKYRMKVSAQCPPPFPSRINGIFTSNMLCCSLCLQGKSSVSWSVYSGFSHMNIIKMACLDAIQFSGLIVSAAGVSPTGTVILLHANTPFVVLGSHIMFDGRSYTRNQMRGVLMISSAVIISFVRPMEHLIMDENISFISSCVCYVLFTGIQGVAMLFKEKCIIEYAKPLDVHELSFWLFFYQLLITIAISPAIYVFQGEHTSMNLKITKF